MSSAHNQDNFVPSQRFNPNQTAPPFVSGSKFDAEFCQSTLPRNFKHKTVGVASYFRYYFLLGRKLAAHYRSNYPSVQELTESNMNKLNLLNWQTVINYRCLQKVQRERRSTNSGIVSAFKRKQLKTYLIWRTQTLNRYGVTGIHYISALTDLKAI